MLHYPVSPPHLQAIGQIAVAFSSLEFHLAAVAGLLVAPRDQRLGVIITAELSFRNLLALAASSYRYKESDLARFEEFEELLKCAGRLEEERNQIMHCIWAAGSTPDTICRVKFTAKQKRGYDAKFEEKSLHDLNELADALMHLTEDIIKWQLAYVKNNGLMGTIISS